MTQRNIRDKKSLITKTNNDYYKSSKFNSQQNQLSSQYHTNQQNINNILYTKCQQLIKIILITKPILATNSILQHFFQNIQIHQGYHASTTIGNNQISKFPSKQFIQVELRLKQNIRNIQKQLDQYAKIKDSIKKMVIPKIKYISKNYCSLSERSYNCSQLLTIYLKQMEVKINKLDLQISQSNQNIDTNIYKELQIKQNNQFLYQQNKYLKQSNLRLQQLISELKIKNNQLTKNTSRKNNNTYQERKINKKKINHRQNTEIENNKFIEKEIQSNISENDQQPTNQYKKQRCISLPISQNPLELQQKKQSCSFLQVQRLTKLVLQKDEKINLFLRELSKMKCQQNFQKSYNNQRYIKLLNKFFKKALVENYIQLIQQQQKIKKYLQQPCSEHQLYNLHQELYKVQQAIKKIQNKILNQKQVNTNNQVNYNAQIENQQMISSDNYNKTLQTQIQQNKLKILIQEIDLKINKLGYTNSYCNLISPKHGKLQKVKRQKSKKSFDSFSTIEKIIKSKIKHVKQDQQDQLSKLKQQRNILKIVMQYHNKLKEQQYKICKLQKINKQIIIHKKDQYIVQENTKVLQMVKIKDIQIALLNKTIDSLNKPSQNQRIKMLQAHLNQSNKLLQSANLLISSLQSTLKNQAIRKSTHFFKEVALNCQNNYQQLEKDSLVKVKIQNQQIEKYINKLQNQIQQQINKRNYFQQLLKKQQSENQKQKNKKQNLILEYQNKLQTSKKEIRELRSTIDNSNNDNKQLSQKCQQISLKLKQTKQLSNNFFQLNSLLKTQIQTLKNDNNQKQKYIQDLKLLIQNQKIGIQRILTDKQQHYSTLIKQNDKDKNNIQTKQKQNKNLQDIKNNIFINKEQLKQREQELTLIEQKYREIKSIFQCKIKTKSKKLEQLQQEIIKLQLLTSNHRKSNSNKQLKTQQLQNKILQIEYINQLKNIQISKLKQLLQKKEFQTQQIIDKSNKKIQNQYLKYDQKVKQVKYVKLLLQDALYAYPLQKQIKKQIKNKNGQQYRKLIQNQVQSQQYFENSQQSIKISKQINSSYRSLNQQSFINKQNELKNQKQKDMKIQIKKLRLNIQQKMFQEQKSKIKSKIKTQIPNNNQKVNFVIEKLKNIQQFIFGSTQQNNIITLIQNIKKYILQSKECINQIIQTRQKIKSHINKQYSQKQIISINSSYKQKRSLKKTKKNSQMNLQLNGQTNNNSQQKVINQIKKFKESLNIIIIQTQNKIKKKQQQIGNYENLMKKIQDKVRSIEQFILPFNNYLNIVCSLDNIHQQLILQQSTKQQKQFKLLIKSPIYQKYSVLSHCELENQGQIEKYKKNKKNLYQSQNFLKTKHLFKAMSCSDRIMEISQQQQNKKKQIDQFIEKIQKEKQTNQKKKSQQLQKKMMQSIKISKQLKRKQSLKKNSDQQINCLQSIRIVKKKNEDPSNSNRGQISYNLSQSQNKCQIQVQTSSNPLSQLPVQPQKIQVLDQVQQEQPEMISVIHEVQQNSKLQKSRVQINRSSIKSESNYKNQNKILENSLQQLMNNFLNNSSQQQNINKNIELEIIIKDQQNKIKQLFSYKQ